ncbi:MAG: 50S ribosomal protein L11 methyltransferase [Armatimonadetes bacterium]|nr:50S ribosomal protein L11 methyltransferase [Armatimonadota bacterium]
MDEMQFPDWQELVLTVATERCDEALARLAMIGYEQAWIDQPIEHLRTPDGWVPSPRDPAHVLIHLYCDPDDTAAVDTVRQALGDLVAAVTSATLATENWLDLWRHGRQVVQLADGWSICPPWLLDDAPVRERAVVIDPGLAFGAGDHPTTQDCGRLIVALTRAGDRVLDLGAGSGVLSILALKLGAESAVADRPTHGTRGRCHADSARWPV